MTESPTSAEPTPEADDSRPARFTTTDIALIAAFTGLICASTLVGDIPTGTAVPITLQTVAIALSGALLGPVRGFLAVALYLLLGGIGLPVFADHTSGFAKFAGISGGYLVSFPLMAALVGYLVKYVAGPARTRAVVIFACSIAGSILIVHPLGIAGMMIYSGEPLSTVWKWDLPFWFGDLIKTGLVAIVAAEVHRAFPNLLRR